MSEWERLESARLVRVGELGDALESAAESEPSKVAATTIAAQRRGSFLVDIFIRRIVVPRSLRFRGQKRVFRSDGKIGAHAPFG